MLLQFPWHVPKIIVERADKPSWTWRRWSWPRWPSSRLWRLCTSFLLQWFLPGVIVWAFRGYKLKDDSHCASCDSLSVQHWWDLSLICKNILFYRDQNILVWSHHTRHACLLITEPLSPSVVLPSTCSLLSFPDSLNPPMRSQVLTPYWVCMYLSQTQNCNFVIAHTCKTDLLPTHPGCLHLAVYENVLTFGEVWLSLLYLYTVCMYFRSVWVCILLVRQLVCMHVQHTHVCLCHSVCMCV